MTRSSRPHVGLPENGAQGSGLDNVPFFWLQFWSRSRCSGSRRDRADRAWTPPPKRAWPRGQDRACDWRGATGGDLPRGGRGSRRDSADGAGALKTVAAAEMDGPHRHPIAGVAPPPSDTPRPRPRRPARQRRLSTRPARAESPRRLGVARGGEGAARVTLRARPSAWWWRCSAAAACSPQPWRALGCRATRRGLGGCWVCQPWLGSALWRVKSMVLRPQSVKAAAATPRRCGGAKLWGCKMQAWWMQTLLYLRVRGDVDAPNRLCRGHRILG